jgi:transformation/transcription domain-associated protein
LSNPTTTNLRLVVTFQPDTQHAGFLVPIDRCVALAKAGIYAAPGHLGGGNGASGAGADRAHEAHYKEQARARAPRVLAFCLRPALDRVLVALLEA